MIHDEREMSVFERAPNNDIGDGHGTQVNERNKLVTASSNVTQLAS